MHIFIHLGRSATIQNACLLRDEMLDAMVECEKVTLDISQLEEVDLSFFQMVYSAHIHALKRGKSIEFNENASEHLVATLTRAGLVDLLPATDLNSWLRGGLSQ